jgi:hypothetical protein
MTKKNISDIRGTSIIEENVEDKLIERFKNTSVPDNEILYNLSLFLSSKILSRILFFNELYKKIVTHQGVIMEFGVRWGTTLNLLQSLRGVYEPFNRHRKIIGFDTFEGFTSVTKLDPISKKGDFAVTNKYEDELEEILKLQEKLNPIPHIKKFEIVKGDIIETLPQYLQDNPETIVSLVFFDLDIYKPTKKALEVIKPYLTKGSVLVFDELCDSNFPGETIALSEVFGLNNVELKRLPITSRISYMEIR